MPLPIPPHRIDRRADDQLSPHNPFPLSIPLAAMSAYQPLEVNTQLTRPLLPHTLVPAYPTAYGQLPHRATGTMHKGFQRVGL